MPRYINADALAEKKFQKPECKCFGEGPAYRRGWNDAVDAIIENEPSADVQPVRHGTWIHDGFDTPHGVDWMHCSECGKRDKYCQAAITNYCSDCGAIMDGEQHEG